MDMLVESIIRHHLRIGIHRLGYGRLLRRPFPSTIELYYLSEFVLSCHRIATLQ